MIRRLSTLLLLACLVAACAPRLYPPTVEVNDAYRYGDRFRQDTLQVDSCWWRLFGDTTLNLLVERALEQNRDLRSAVARIEQAREQLRIARAAFLPAEGVELEAKPTYNRETKIVQSYAAGATLSWEISLFGALRHTTEAARAEYAAAVWSARGVALSLAAEVATAYFTRLQYERDLLIATHTYQLRRESAALIDSLYCHGMSSGIDREQAYSQVYQAEADIPRYRSAIEQSGLALNLLLGEPPQRVLYGVGERLLTDRQPDTLGIGVPSELLQRRPDVMASYYALQQAAAKVGVARAARFPSLMLTANGGIGAASIKGLSSSNPAVWSAVGTLTTPIWAAGKLKAEERTRVAAYNEAAYGYEQTLLGAFSDVEQTLSTLAANRIETERYRALVASYTTIDEMAHALYRNGMINYLEVIDAERTLYAARMELVNLVAQQYINYVTLCKALGGGWR